MGCETALHLAKLGKKVTVVEMQSALAPDASTTGRNELMTEIDREPNFIALTGARCQSVTATSVTYVKDGQEPVSYTHLLTLQHSRWSRSWGSPCSPGPGAL